MLKKMSIVCIILAILAISVSLGFYFNNKASKGSGEVNETDEVDETTEVAYNVSLVESNNFDLRTETYDNGGLNVFIKSKEKYSYFSIEYKCYDENDELVHQFGQWVNNVNVGDEVSNDFVVDNEKVKNVQVKINDAVYDDTKVFLDKNKLNFTVNDYRYENKVVVNLSATNPFDKALNLIHGYIRFYKGKQLVKTEILSIENINIGEDIFTTMEFENIKEYDNIKVSINVID